MADNIRATPQNPYTGALARGLRSLQQLAGQYQVDPRIPLLGGTSVDELLSLPGAASLAEDVSYYGPRALIRGGNVATGGIGTFRLDPRVADVADVAMNVTPLAAMAGKTATRGAMAAGRAGERLAERVVPQVMERGGIGAQLMQDMATGSRSQVVKPKGGNWLSGTVERVVEPMRVRVVGSDPAARLRDLDAAYAQNVEAGVAMDPAVFARERARLEPEAAINRWLDTKLAKYMRNEMATPEDPLRALAERGVLHYDPTPTGYSVAGPRVAAGFPEEGMAQSDLAKRWEKRADTFFNQLQASDITRGYPELVEKDPWLAKVPPETRVYELLGGANEELGMQHLVDELKNAINPESGLPASLRLKYQDLEKVTVPQAVERVAKINEWRAAQKAEADMARAMNPATQVVKEYPEQGFKWVELRQPKELPEGWTEKNGAYYDPKGERHVHPGTESLADALKYEGETMGHCVGGYCPDVVEGRSRIYSLRDKKGQPHVTIEVKPGVENPSITEGEFRGQKRFIVNNKGTGFPTIEEAQQYAREISTPEIVQIKGKANRAPNPEYLPAVQDFVRSGNWSGIGDLKNTGLIDLDKAGVSNQMRGGQRFVTQDEYEALVRKNAEGFSLGGLVQKYAEGGLVMNQANIYGSDAKQDPASAYKFADGGQAGSPPAYAEGGLVANSPTVDFDPARIDAIVGELHAMNAG